MSSVFVLNQPMRQAKAISFAPPDREHLAAMLEMWPYAPLEIRRLGLDVHGVGVNRHDRRPATLVIAAAPLPAVLDNVAGVYSVQGLPVVGKALIAAQLPGGPSTLGPGLRDETHFLRLEWGPEEVAALIEWERAVPATAESAQPYDIAQLESYIKFMCEHAVPVYPNGGALRLYAVDPFGDEAGAMNFDPRDWLSARRYALDCFDRRQTVLHELAVRASVPFGSAAETPVIGLWAEKAPTGADFTITAGELQVAAKLTHTRGKGDKKFAKTRPERIPLPGVPTWSGSAPTQVTWSRVS